MRKGEKRRTEKGEGSDVKAHEYYNDSGSIFYTIVTSQYSPALISSLTWEWHDTVHYKCREACVCMSLCIFYLNENHFQPWNSSKFCFCKWGQRCQLGFFFIAKITIRFRSGLCTGMLDWRFEDQLRYFQVLDLDKCSNTNVCMHACIHAVCTLTAICKLKHFKLSGYMLEKGLSLFSMLEVWLSLWSRMKCTVSVQYFGLWSNTKTDDIHISLGFVFSAN